MGEVGPFVFMADDVLDITLALIRLMEGAILGLHHASVHLPDDRERGIIDALITEAETKLVSIKRRIIQ